MELYSPPTQHPDGLLPVVGGLGGAAVVVAPVGGPPDVAGVGAPDGGDHAGVEEDEEHHRDQEEEEEGHLVDWVPLWGEGYTGDRAPLATSDRSPGARCSRRSWRSRRTPAPAPPTRTGSRCG